MAYYQGCIITIEVPEGFDDALLRNALTNKLPGITIEIRHNSQLLRPKVTARTLTMKVGQFPVEAALVEEKMDIVTAKDLLSAGKLTRCRRCDAPRRSLVTLATYP